MPSTPAEARRATEIEQAGPRRKLSHVEVEEYYDLAAVSFARVHYAQRVTQARREIGR